MKAYGFSRIFWPDTEFSRRAAEILEKPERAMQKARARVLGLAGLGFAEHVETNGLHCPALHVARDGATKALCGRPVVCGRTDGGCYGECRTCSRLVGKIVGVWVEGES